MSSLLLLALLLQRAPLPARVAADTLVVPRPVVVRLVLGGTCATPDSVLADAFELELASDVGRRSTTGTVRLLRGLDARSDALQQLIGDTPRRARLEVDSAGKRVLDAALDGVMVQSYRLVAATPDLAADAQRLLAEEALAQLR